MVRVTNVETGHTEDMTDNQFCGTLARFCNDEEIEALHAGDKVCIETGDEILDVEVV